MKLITDYSINKKFPAFQGLRSKHKTLQDLFNNMPAEYFIPQKSIEKISEIRPVMLAGTKCRNSIPLRKFWDFFEIDKKTFLKGFSTNKDGFANSFLKTKSCIPISTSYIHDCSVMYLFNKETKTHALYHAAPDCKLETLNFMIKTLMPEGFTKGAIIPGDSIFYRKHRHNMENMFNLMKQSNPHALINVYHGTTRYPEITGYKGFVYEIPNKKVKEQMLDGILDAEDFGQATFKILNLQGYNTFENINLCSTKDELYKLKQAFKQAKYPPEIFKILSNIIDAREAEL